MDSPTSDRAPMRRLSFIPRSPTLLLKRGLLVVTAVVLVLLFVRTIESRSGLDEGYNLEVVANWPQGIGYASFGNHRLDAWWSAKKLWQPLPKDHPLTTETFQPWFFDPRVTTGPTVLMPLALLWRAFSGSFLAVRLFMWAFVAGLFLVVWWALASDHRRLASLALASCVVCSLWFGFRPGAVLGELPAAVFLAAACVALARSRFFLAGVFLGAASLAKFLMLPASFLLIALVAAESFVGTEKKPQKPLLVVFGFMLPWIAFELYRFLSLGSLDAWLSSWQEFLAFSREQTTALAPQLLRAKWRSLRTYGPGPFFALACFSAFGALMATPRLQQSDHKRLGAIIRNPAHLMLVASAPIVFLWLLSSAQTSYRQAVPASLLFFSGLMLLLVSRVGNNQMLASQGIKATIFYVATLLLTILALTQWGIRVGAAFDMRTRFKSQLAAAKSLTSSGATSLSSAIKYFEPFPLLTGLPASPCPGPNQALVVTGWAQAVAGGEREALRSLCGNLIFDNKDVLICYPKWQPFSLEEVTILDWGPKEIKISVSHKPQAFWFRLQRPITQRPTLVFLVSGQPAGFVTWAADGTWFSASSELSFTTVPNKLELSLWDPCSANTKSLDYLTVTE